MHVPVSQKENTIIVGFITKRANECLAITVLYVSVSWEEQPHTGHKVFGAVGYAVTNILL